MLEITLTHTTTALQAAMVTPTTTAVQTADATRELLLRDRPSGPGLFSPLAEPGGA